MLVPALALLPWAQAGSTCGTVAAPQKVLTLSAAANASLVTEHVFDVRLRLPGGAQVQCTSPDVPAELHVVRTEDAATNHTLTVGGLLADTRYTCTATPVCPEAPPASGRTVRLTTPALPSWMPSFTVARDTSHDMVGAYTMYNTEDVCYDTEQRFIMLDPDGNVRWYWEVPSDGLNIGLEVDWEDRQLVTGGGYSRSGGMMVVDEHGTLLHQVSGLGYLFHHHAEQLYDGTWLQLAEVGNRFGTHSFLGFALVRIDPADDSVLWTYDSQRAVISGDLSWGSGDAWHANWATIVDEPDGEKAYVSLCYLSSVVKIDVTTGVVDWVLGPSSGDFVLSDLDGTTLGSAGYSSCQHGLDVVPHADGDTISILYYDNGWSSATSRGLEIVVDESTMTATQTWTWTEPDFYMPVLGDADYLDDGHVLLGIGATPCWGSDPDHPTSVVEVDMASGDEVWRVDASKDSLYRAQRIHGCDAFDNARYCPELAP